ncbi:nucleotidyltransferase domain-containing protein [Acetobacteraceae bacterium]|nr:nucleotidyltransferase domain-containing protein [Acetobacteraceae bacterium]
MPKNLSALRLEPKYLKIVQGILQKIIPDHDVAVFGSRTQPEAVLRRGSDLDLALMGKNGLDLKTQSILATEFDEAPLPMKIDLVLWAEMTPEFQKLIQNDLIFIQKKKS